MPRPFPPAPFFPHTDTTPHHRAPTAPPTHSPNMKGFEVKSLKSKVWKPEVFQPKVLKSKVWKSEVFQTKVLKSKVYGVRNFEVDSIVVKRFEVRSFESKSAGVKRVDNYAHFKTSIYGFLKGGGCPSCLPACPPPSHPPYPHPTPPHLPLPHPLTKPIKYLNPCGYYIVTLL